MPKKKPHRRARAKPDSAIVQLADKAAGILAEVFDVDKDALLHRPRPSGKMEFVRTVLVGVLHLQFCFNAKTGEIARRSAATDAKNWQPVSQKRIALALQRDRGVIAKAAAKIDQAGAGDIGVRIALEEIAEQVSNLLTHAKAWSEALDQEMLEAASMIARFEAMGEADEIERFERIEAAIAANPAGDERTIRCHSCRGEGKVRVHKLHGDPTYLGAWKEAEAQTPSPSGFHVLTCRFCKGAGVRSLASPAAASAPLILAAQPKES